MKYDLASIMRHAWRIFRKAAKKIGISFAEALHRAWAAAKAAPINAARIEAVNTWAGWRDLGYEVVHGSKCLYQVDLLYPANGDNATYRASFFGASQVCEPGSQAA